jgi:predicted RNA-binding Zn ribbon-like protein
MTDSPHLVGDHLAIDFRNSFIGPSGESHDWLSDGEGLLEWLAHSGAIEAGVAQRPPGAKSLDVVAAEARQLREWFSSFLERHAGRELKADALRELAPLNRLLERADAYRIVEVAKRHESDRRNALTWRQKRRWAPEQLLMPVAEAIGDLICTADFRLVRTCEGHDCQLMFYDRTKAHARRWCSMAICGNRAKAAAHRSRQRELAGR